MKFHRLIGSLMSMNEIPSVEKTFLPNKYRHKFPQLKIYICEQLSGNFSN